MYYFKVSLTGYLIFISSQHDLKLLENYVIITILYRIVFLGFNYTYGGRVEMAEGILNEIVAEKKHGEFHVHLKGRPGLWAQGITIMQAVGTLICDHPEAFNIKLNYDAVDSLTPSKN
jgi:hypothetical protein